MKHDILLKGTDIRVSPFALGTVNAGLDYKDQDANDLFNYYVDNGGNLIDTARVYFDWAPGEIGRSERVIGDWLRKDKRRDEIVLMTKGGHPDKDAMDISRMSQKDIEYDINLSLTKLGVDYIDIYFYHRDDINQSVGELIERMEGFKKKGIIRYYGCSNWTNERMIEADKYAKEHGYTGFIANQNLLNAASKYMKPFPDKTMVTCNEKSLDFFRNSNNTPMPYFGLCSGFFHILKNSGEEAVKDSPYYTEKNLLIAKKINEICEKYNCTISQALMGFYYNQDFTVIPLAGPISIPQLDELIKSTEFNFNKEDFNF